MTMFRTTWFFKVNNYGWTENLHHSAVDLATVSARVNTLAPFRKAILAGNAQLAAVRISDDDLFRDSTVNVNPPIFGNGTYPGVSDPAFTSLLIRWDASPTTRKSLYLRGIPDELVDTGVFTNDPTWQTRWNDYRNQVIALGFAIKRLSVTANPIFTLFQVDAAGIATTNQLHNFLAGDRVHVTGIKTTPPVPPAFTVLTPTSSFSFALGNWAPRGLQIPNNGKVRKYLFEVVPITAGVWLRVIKKSTGRPFDSPVGRRRRRR